MLSNFPSIIYQREILIKIGLEEIQDNVNCKNCIHHIIYNSQCLYFYVWERQCVGTDSACHNNK
jgi:hypothetical protein